jgi:hypothetical protein
VLKLRLSSVTLSIIRLFIHLSNPSFIRPFNAQHVNEQYALVWILLTPHFERYQQVNMHEHHKRHYLHIEYNINHQSKEIVQELFQTKPRYSNIKAFRRQKLGETNTSGPTYEFVKKN